MNISLEKTDELNATVIIDLEKQDYSEKVEKELRRVQKNVAMRGFRPGKAPLDMVKRMYGKSILADEIQQTATDALNSYIQEQKLDILGYPIASTRVESDLDIENKEQFRFAFDLGMAPEFELQISDKDQLENFVITVTDKEVDEDIDYARKRYGKMEDVESAEGEDIVYCTLTELNEQGETMEGGVEGKSASLVPNLVQDEALKNTLLGIKKDAALTVNIFQLFNNNDSVISSTLGIAKEGVKDLSMDFRMVVTDVKRRTLAELNEEYFQEVFGPQDAPATIEEYRERIKSNLENYYRNEADLWIDHQIGHLLLEKHAFQLPDEFLKRWLVTTKPETYTAENIEEKYAEEKQALVRRLIIDKIAAKYSIEPTHGDIRDEARTYYLGLYRQYGLTMMPDDNFLDSTIDKRLEEREFVSQMADRVVYRKAYDQVKQLISLVDKPVTVEEYFQHVNEHKHAHAE